MSDAVVITMCICLTIVVLGIIGRDGMNNGKDN